MSISEPSAPVAVTPPLRLATPADADLVFRWRNDPWIVALSSSGREVSWEQHTAWFASVLDAERHLLFIIQSDDGEPAGTVRLDRGRDGEAVVTIYLLRPFTGRGLGPRALEAACRAAFTSWPELQRITARVRSENVPSLKAFQRTGFTVCADAVGGPPGHTVLQRCRDQAPAAPLWDDDNRHIVQYFSKLIARHGIDARALDWGRAESQRLRFAVLASIGSLEGKEVLDVGCGQGDLLAWLRDTGVRAGYHGIDITPEMIAIARRRFPEARFTLGNVLANPPPTSDYVFASGLFYLRKHRPLEFLQQMVATLFRCCRCGVAFNSLSAWAPRKDEGEFYADPLEVLSFCRTLTPRLAMRHDYHPHDFTVFLWK